MKGFRREHGVLVARFDTDEAGLLAGLVDQLVELLGEYEPVSQQGVTSPASSDDPFAQWESEFSEEPGIEDAGQIDLDVDPVIERLFPDACPGDPVASWEFRRFTQAGQRNEKLADAQVVMDDLTETDRRGRCPIAEGHLMAWMKTLAAVRLAIAVRLDITDETSADEAAQRPESDPRWWLHEVYQWLGFVHQELIESIADY